MTAWFLDSKMSTLMFNTMHCREEDLEVEER